MKIAVVDASVAVKWVADEDDVDSADWLLGHAGLLIAPAHWLGEVANSLWAKAAIRGELTKAEVTARIAWLAGLPVATTSLSALIQHAGDIAFDVRVTIYDALYLALAQSRGVPFVTADRRLFDRMQKNKAFRHTGVWLADVTRYRERR